MNYKDVISHDPKIRGGKAIIRGMRIAVIDVLEMLASRMTWEEILADFPDLQESDIVACLEYAADKERASSQVA